MTDDLSTLRTELDAIDRDIVALLEQRFAVTDRVAAYKNAHDIPLTDTSREREVMDRIRSATDHPVLKEHITDIYERIISLNKTARLFKKHTELPFKRIGVIGLGMMGGSVLKALRMKGPDTPLFTLERDSEDVRLAREQGYLTDTCASWWELASRCDLIILATPIDAVEDAVKQISAAVPGDAEKPLVVIDLASVKTRIASTFAQATGTIEFLPTHPMAGSEKTGFAAAQGMLYTGKPWVIAPHERNRSETVERVSALVRYLGSVPVTLTPQEHDRQVAYISHLVFMMSCYLYAFAQSHIPDAITIAGSGFRSMTRLASGSAEMHTSIVRENYDNIAVALMEFLSFVKEQPLEEKELKSFFEETKAARDAYMAEMT